MQCLSYCSIEVTNGVYEMCNFSLPWTREMTMFTCRIAERRDLVAGMTVCEIGT